MRASGDQIERWVGTGLLAANRQNRKSVRHQHIPLRACMTNPIFESPVKSVAGRMAYKDRALQPTGSLGPGGLT